MKLLNRVQRRVRAERILRNVNRRNYKTHLKSCAEILGKHSERIVVMCLCGESLADLRAMKKVPVCGGKSE